VRAEPLYPAGGELSEGPLQLTSGPLAWVDILRGDVHRLDRSTGRHDVTTFGEPVGAVTETTGGAVVAACRSGLRLVGSDPDTSPLLASGPAAGCDLRMNDGKADPAGRFVGGTMSLGAPPRPGAGSLWSFGRGGPVVLVDDVTISNGLAWSGDGSTMYFIDTPTHRIDAFDYDIATGGVSGRRPVVSIDPDDGDPDGMCIDIDGGLWVALWGGHAVRRYVGGHLDAVVEVPTPYVTCPAFVGQHLDELVVTTAWQPFGRPHQGAGDLYVARPGISGPPPGRVELAVVAPGRTA